jgi:formyl-CoA transferase/CoA:oxalate CoA-transferase
MSDDTIGPLDGVRVLDFTRHMSGPYGTSFLADYGADVIKIESMPHGEPSRQTGMKFKGDRGEVAATYLMWNRGKRSLPLDLRQPEAVEIVRRLAAKADVVVENYRPGVAEDIGLGYERLSALNPRLIYISLSAFGRGPLAPLPGTDPVVQAVSGVMSVTGEPDGTPVLVGIPIADFTGAMMLTQAVMLALLARVRTGEGQKVELSMLYGLISALTTRLATYWATGVEPRRNGGRHSVVVPYQVFETADGYVVAGVWNGGNAKWPLFCEALEIPEVGLDPRYATNELRMRNKDELLKVLEDAFKLKPASYWAPRFESRGVLFGPVNTFSDILNHPHVQQSGLIAQVEHPLLGTIPQLAPVIGLTKTPGRVNPPAPLLGQHSAEILRDLAGYTADQIADLTARGVVGVVQEDAR